MANKGLRRKLKKDYAAGKGSYADLARANNLSVSTVKRWAKEDGWQEARSQTEAKVNAGLAEAAANETIRVQTGVLSTAGVLLGKLAAAIDGYGDTMSVKEMQGCASALKDLQGILGEKNDLDLQEQEARIDRLTADAEARKQAEGDKTVVVELGEELMGYAG